MNRDFPWINPWRLELQRLFPASVRRRPALRRSLNPEDLFSVDLPACASPADCLVFLDRVREAGWQACQADGWIQLRPPEGRAPEGWFPEEPRGEAACLLALLSRHPGTASSSREMTALLKAREQGATEWERACRILHENFAARLRLHQALPQLIFSEKE